MRTIETYPGDEISRVAQQAVDIVAAGEPGVQFDFNEIVLTVTPGRTANDVVAEYMARLKERGDAYRATPEYRAREEEAARAERDRKAALADALASAPAAPTMTDPEIWKSWVDANQDPYGRACMEFAERWARLMEGRVAAGDLLADCARPCSRLADEGITGFMYGAAVGMLAKAWVHGEELRRWHNLATQIGDESERANESGGTLNPALLSIG